MKVEITPLLCGVVVNEDGEPCSNAATKNVRLIAGFYRYSSMSLYDGPACDACITALQDEKVTV